MDFFRKQKSRGKYRTSGQRLAEAKARSQTFLEKQKLRYLKAHPELMENLVLKTYFPENQDEGKEDEGYFPGAEPQPRSALDILEEAKKIREAIKSDLPSEIGKQTTLMQVIEILKCLPSLLPVLPALISALNQQQAQQGQQPPAPAPAVLPPPASKQIEEAPTMDGGNNFNQLADYVGKLISETPGEAARELYQRRNEDGTPSFLLWQIFSNFAFVSGSDAFAMIKGLKSNPDPKFSVLFPVIDRLTAATEKKKWVSLFVEKIQSFAASGE